MKNTLSAVLLFAATAFAQGPGASPHGAPSPADTVARLTTLLSLTSAQQAQATTIFTNEQTAASSIHTQIETARASLDTAIKSNATATIDTLASQLGSYEARMAGIHAKAQAAFYALLTADQQSKSELLHEGRPGSNLRTGRP